jgi:aryl-alcohol dehydrogenase-like predicted oxidoreductase
MTAETTRLDPVGRLTEVPLGEQGLTVSAQGLGAMGMTAFYVADPKVHETESLATFDEAQALGVTHIDT